MTLQPRPTDVLLVIDMQRDFLPSTPEHSSALPVTGGDTILPGINAVAQRFAQVLLTQDWHPHGHISFASAHPGKHPFTDTVEAPYGTQTLWPDHCIQGTPGADLDPRLHIPHAELIVRKGFRKEIDSYSAFLENDHKTSTGLAGYLQARNLNRLFLCGLAYDFCVGFSAIDGSTLGFECLVLEDLTRAVALPGSVERTNACFADASVQRIASSAIA
ncbi:MAG TPA: nicotinamidase [Acidobacteriaceae bacterium]|jgi:nicotinamidase/pyrazinamidase|nr:nicotinamidase [Acidobacteriaceae bacterium]